MNSRRFFLIFTQSHKSLFVFRTARSHANPIDISDHFTQSYRKLFHSITHNLLSNYTYRARIPSDVITHKIIFSRHHSKIAHKECISCNHTHLCGRGRELEYWRHPHCENLLSVTYFSNFIHHRLR